MAKKQTLVHLHTSSGSLETIVSVIGRDVQHGEIVVRHKDDKPELYIKKDNSTYATFIDSVAVDAKISAATTTVNTSIDNLSKDVKALSGATEAGFAAASADTVAALAEAKTYAETKATEAKDAAIGAASAYTDTVVATEKAALQGEIDAVQNNVTALSDVVSAFSASVITTYATSAATEAAIAKAKGEAVAAASAYTDGEVAELKSELEGKISGATKNLQDAIDGVEDKVEELSGSVETIKGDLENAIASAVTKAYVYRGSVASYDALPGNAENGDVYNVTNESNVNGKIYPEGTNFAWVAPIKDENGEILEDSHWDALGGTVDLSIYATSADTVAAIQTVQTNVDNLGKDVKALSAATEAGFVAASADTVAALAEAKTYAETKATEAKDAAIGAASAYTDGQVAAAKEAIKETTDALNNKFNNYATSAATEAAIAKAKGEAVAAASAYTDGEVAELKKDVDTVISAFSASVVTEFAAVKKTTDDLDTRIDDLEAISGATQSAIQNVKIVGINGVVSSMTENVITFDFTTAVIDCGLF